MLVVEALAECCGMQIRDNLIVEYYGYAFGDNATYDFLIVMEKGHFSGSLSVYFIDIYRPLTLL